MDSRYSEVAYNCETNLFEVTRFNGRYRTRGPLNVGLQVTRECNLSCIYCCESSFIKAMTLQQIEQTIDALASVGTRLVKVTGGEPLLRDDVFEIISYARAKGLLVAMDTNATLVTEEVADFMSRNLIYIESTIDGTPSTHDRVRGRFTDVIKGITRVRRRGLRVYIVTVLLGAALDGLEYVAELSDDLGVGILKIVAPIPKGRGNYLPKEYLENKNLEETWKRVCEFKHAKNLKIKILLSDWNRMGPGSVILIHPNGDVVGSPSIGERDCVTPLGNILNEDLSKIWLEYPHTANHISRYTGESVYCSD